MPRAFRVERREDGLAVVRMETVWRAVRRWAERNGHEYVSSYGVVGVAPA